MSGNPPPSDSAGQPPPERPFDPSEQTPGTRPPSGPPSGYPPPTPPPGGYPPQPGSGPGGYPPQPGYGPQQPPPGYPPQSPPGYPPQAPPGYPPPSSGGYPPPSSQGGYPPAAYGPQGYTPPAGYEQPPPVPSSQWSAPTPSGTTDEYGDQSYGATSAASSASAGRSVNVKAVNPLDWAILACGFLAFIFSFLSYYTASVRGFPTISGTGSAWHGFFGWFAALVALISAGVLAVALFVPEVRIPLSVRLIVLGGFLLATICVLLAWIITPASVGGGIANINSGRGAGFYLSLIVIVAGLVLCFVRLRATGGKLPWEAK